MGQVVAYRRVSSEGQSLDRQEFQDAVKVFEETESGAKRDGPQLNLMLDYIRDGDTVQVWELSRLARSLRDLEEIVEKITAKGASVHFLSEGLKFGAGSGDDIFSTFQMQVLGAFAQMERSLTKKRQREGIQKAKARGVYKGRQATIDAEKVKALLEKGLSASEVAKTLGVNRSSVYRLAKD